MTDRQSALVGDKYVPHLEYASLEGDDQARCPTFCGGRYRFVGVMTKTRFRAHDQERACTVTEVFVDLVYIFCLQAMLQNHIDSQTSLWHFIVTYGACPGSPTRAAAPTHMPWQHGIESEFGVWVQLQCLIRG